MHARIIPSLRDFEISFQPGRGTTIKSLVRLTLWIPETLKRLISSSSPSLARLRSPWQPEGTNLLSLPRCSQSKAGNRESASAKAQMISRTFEFIALMTGLLAKNPEE
jgi:hypothetical protein